MIASTANPPKRLITQEQVDQFHRDGYCVVDGIYSEAELVEIEAFFEAFRTVGEKVFDEGMKYEEIDPSKRQLRAIHPDRLSKKVEGWMLQDQVMDTLAVILGMEALAVQTMYYYKPPGAKGQGMHQDNYYLRAAPATCIGVWSPIDDATDENGCLWVAPGSHRDDIYCVNDKVEAEPWKNYGDTHIKPFPRQHKPVPVPVMRGQTLFFGGNLIHGSGPNRSKTRSRRTFIGHYINEMSEEIANFYHPVRNRKGEVVSHVNVSEGGGPCGDGWGNQGNHLQIH